VRNGSYYANLASNFPSPSGPEAFKGFEAVAVSRTDDVQAAAAGDKSAWLPSVIVSRQNSVLFSDKDAIWADNAASSKYFGNVYVAHVAFRGQRTNPLSIVPEPVIVARSTDGGATWTQTQISQAANTSGAGLSGGRQGATIRTDSNGTVYVFWYGSLNGHDVQYMARSFDGGQTFERPRAVADVTEVGKLDPVQGRLTFDGVAGARTDSFPSADIANGAPTGADATDEIVLTWADARNGLNNEQALVQYSTDHGNTWSAPVNAAPGSDRPDFPAIAISPNGMDVYLTYDNFLQPWQSSIGTTDATPRLMQGVVRHASISKGSAEAPAGAPVEWSDLHRGPTGDARGSSANSLVAEFLGDYNYAVATRTYGAAVWNDVRNAEVSSAIDAYRQSLLTSSPLPKPVPPTDRFGNSDIFGWSSFGDPTRASGLATSSGTSQSPGVPEIQSATDSALALIAIPDVLTPKGRKRALSSPAVDIQSEAMDGVQRSDRA
jgi:hypothetical protein